MAYCNCSVFVMFCFREVFGLICFVLFCIPLFLAGSHVYLPKGLGSDRNEQKNMSGNYLTFLALTHISHSG